MGEEAIEAGPVISVPSSRPAVAVELRGVTKRFEDVVAVDRIDLEISDGEFFSLLGPSGCGKTTTLRMIAGLDVPTEGSMRVAGVEVDRLPPDKRPVNTVFQNYALFPHLDVRGNVGFGLKMQGVAKREIRQRVSAALEMVRLGDLAARRPDQLSGGQQQRVALARALVNRPKVLLLDEPLGALDLQLRQGMQTELKTLQRELGITFVFVTHDQEEALTMSDRIGVMHEGRLVQVATPDAVYEHPHNRFVADFIGQTNLLDATVEDASTVCLANGTRLAVDSMLPAGTAVAVLLRPERAALARTDDDPAGSASIDEGPTNGRSIVGQVSSVTYLGSALVYRIALDWMHVDVRAANQPGIDRFEPGESVTVSFRTDAVSLLRE